LTFEKYVCVGSHARLEPVQRSVGVGVIE